MSDPDFDCFRSATGMLLAKRLSRYVTLLIDDGIPANVGRAIGHALDELERKEQRKAAILSAADILDPDCQLSVGKLAKRLSDEIARFNDIPYRRCKSGYRKPNELERHLIVMLDIGGPKCRSKLTDELIAIFPKRGEKESD